jgi:hypothetical protein
MKLHDSGLRSRLEFDINIAGKNPGEDEPKTDG